MHIRTARERALQTLCYEAGGIALAAPLYGLIFGEGAVDSVSLMVAMSLAMLVWSPIHNTVFDIMDYRLAGRVASDRPHRLRLVHAGTHELTSIVVTLPIIMAMGNHGFLEALAVDVGLTLLYAGYAYVFHLFYDWLRPVHPVALPLARGDGPALETGA